MQEEISAVEALKEVAAFFGYRIWEHPHKPDVACISRIDMWAIPQAEDLLDIALLGLLEDVRGNYLRHMAENPNHTALVWNRRWRLSIVDKMMPALSGKQVRFFRTTEDYPEDYQPEECLVASTEEIPQS